MLPGMLHGERASVCGLHDYAGATAQSGHDMWIIAEPGRVPFPGPLAIRG